jgi:5-methylcytosine-specific restriction endonuclease McrA
MVRKITEDAKLYKKAYYEKNIEKKKAYDRARYIAKKDEVKNRVKIYSNQNKEKICNYQKEYRKKNGAIIKERRKDYLAQYRIENRGFLAVKNRIRKEQLKLNQTPLWANLKEINVIYKQAKRRANIEGIQYHIDHIIPLNGELVSGLHVLENLQIILAKENLSKGNKYELA